MKKERWYIEGIRSGMIQEARITRLDTRPIVEGCLSAKYVGDGWWQVTNALHERVHAIYKMLVSPFRTRGKREEVASKLKKQAKEWLLRIGPRDNILPPEAVTRDFRDREARNDKRREIAVKRSHETRDRNRRLETLNSDDESSTRCYGELSGGDEEDGLAAS